MNQAMFTPANKYLCRHKKLSAQTLYTKHGNSTNCLQESICTAIFKILLSSFIYFWNDSTLHHSLNDTKSYPREKMFHFIKTVEAQQCSGTEIVPKQLQYDLS